MGKKTCKCEHHFRATSPLKKKKKGGEIHVTKILLFPLKVPSSVAVSIFTSLYNHHHLMSELLQHLKWKPHTIKAPPFPLCILILSVTSWDTRNCTLAWPQPAACFVWRASNVWETSSREKGRGSKKNKEEKKRWMGVGEDTFSQRPGGGCALSRVTNSKSHCLSSWSREGVSFPNPHFPAYMEA